MRPLAECQEADGIDERGVQGALIIQAPQRPSAGLALDQRGLACLPRAGYNGYQPGGDHVLCMRRWASSCACSDGRQIPAG